MRHNLILAVLATSLVLLPIIAGCGTVNINLQTTVKPSGDFTQQFKIEGTGMMGSLLGGSETIQSFKQEGWKVTTERSTDSVSLIATKEFRWNENIVIPSLDGEEIALKNLSSHVRDYIVLKDYLFEVTIPGNPTGTVGTETGTEYEELAKLMLKGMFNMSWTLTLPGKIVESNADTIEDNSATWYFDIDSLEKDHYMTVHSRYINWPVIGGIVAAIVAGLGIFFFIRARRLTR